MLGLKPHLQATHWSISSVVPVKSPVICFRKPSARGSRPMADPHGPRPASWAAVGTRLLAAVLSGRGSQDDRWTRAAHAASLGSSEPGGMVPFVGVADVGGTAVGLVTAVDLLWAV